MAAIDLTCLAQTLCGTSRTALDCYDVGHNFAVAVPTELRFCQ